VAESNSTSSGTATIFGGNCASCTEEGSCVLAEDGSGNRIGVEEVDTIAVDYAGGIYSFALQADRLQCPATGSGKSSCPASPSSPNATQQEWLLWLRKADCPAAASSAIAMSINRAGKQLELVLLDIGNWEHWAAAKGVGNSTDIEASMVKQLDIDEAEAKKERFAYVVVGWNSTRSVESGLVEFQLSGKRKLPCSNRFLFVKGNDPYGKRSSYMLPRKQPPPPFMPPNYFSQSTKEE